GPGPPPLPTSSVFSEAPCNNRIDKPRVTATMPTTATTAQAGMARSWLEAAGRGLGSLAGADTDVAGRDRWTINVSTEWNADRSQPRIGPVGFRSGRFPA